MTILSKKTTSISNATRLLSVAAVAVLSMGMVKAEITCNSPGGVAEVGKSVGLSLGDNGWWPTTSSIYSLTATVKCSSGGNQVASFSASNGGSWTIPSSAYGVCSGNQVYVTYSGNAWDLLKLTHIWTYSATCGTLTLTSPPPPPAATTTVNPPSNPTTTTKSQPDPTTQSQAPPSSQPETTANNPQTTSPTVPPTTTTPGTAPTTTASPIWTTTMIVIPTVISGTSTVITATTAILVNPTTSASAGSTANADGPQISGLPTPSNQSSQSQKSSVSVPAATLGAVGGVAALMLIVFGLVVTRNRRRQRKEEMDREVMEKHGFTYDPTMGNSADDFTLPSLHGTSPYIQMPEQSFQGGLAGGSDDYAYAGAAGAAAYGLNRKIDPDAAKRASDQSSGSRSPAGSNAGGPTLLPFPVPSATSEALKQQYDLANRLSVASQDSATDSMGGPGSPLSNSGAYAAAAAVNHQLYLQEELNQEVILDNSSEGGYASARSSPRASPRTQRSSANASSPFVASVAASTSAVGAYDNARSQSSAYGTAQSPSMSSASYGNDVPYEAYDIPVPAIPVSEWRSEAGRPESKHIRDLIRNVLDDD
ncbi:hypothetical protein BGZ49_005497 [Haplosporangium sp. Z 27]|nr:hypothetical protein BGZ49_005497 [Haplosporangium sp. Z 27]